MTLAAGQVDTLIDDIGDSVNDRKRLRDAVTDWDEVKVLQEGDEVKIGGEVLITYSDGYRLYSVDS